MADAKREIKSVIRSRALLIVPEWPNMKKIEKQPLIKNVEVIPRAIFKMSRVGSLKNAKERNGELMITSSQ